MYVCVQILRGIKIHHHHYVGYIKSSSCDVGSYQNHSFVFLKFGNCRVTLVLNFFAVDRYYCWVAIAILGTADFNDFTEIVNIRP